MEKIGIANRVFSSYCGNQFSFVLEKIEIYNNTSDVCADISLCFWGKEDNTNFPIIINLSAEDAKSLAIKILKLAG